MTGSGKENKTNCTCEGDLETLIRPRRRQTRPATGRGPGFLKGQVTFFALSAGIHIF